MPPKPRTDNEKKKLNEAFARVPDWAWELNGAGDPAQVWIDHRPSRSTSRVAHKVDAGFASGTWVVRLTLPNDLDEVSAEMQPGFVAMGLADASRRLEEKLYEAVRLCRSRGASWAEVGSALGVSRQAAWRRFGVADATP